MLGNNHKAAGWMLRMLGAKVGKRIFWPGSGINMVEYDLLEVQDDCIFGSRSHFYASSMLLMLSYLNLALFLKFDF